MSFINKLLIASAFVLLLGGGMASAQQPVKPVNPSGAVLFPSAFASADNIAAQTATFLHGGLLAWDSGGGNWDRVLLTAGALNVQIQNSSLAVTGTFWQATQPISASTLPLPTGAATSANQDGIIRDGTGDTVQANVISGRLQTDGSGVTQPISGSVTANAGTNLNTSALMLDATFTGRTPAGASPADNESNTNTALSRIGAFNFIWDSGGSNWDRWTGAVTQSGTWNITNISGTISLPTGASTLAEQQTHTTSLQLIDDLPLTQGSSTSGQKGLMGMGAVTTAAPSYTTAQTSPLSLTTAGLLRTDGSGVTQPISGTVTANQGGTWTVQPGNTANTTAWKVDGSAVTQPVSGSVTANAGTNLNTSLLALDSTLTGGTQKTKLVDTGGTNVASISAAGALKVDGSAVTQPVSGTITANAGTNLNTSLLALDASVTVLGATADAAATAGSTGTESAKLRLMTSQLDAIKTAVETIDNGVSGAGYNITQFGGTNFTVAADNSASSTAKMPVMDTRANQYPPTWTEGNQVPQSADLFGNTRTNPRDSKGQELGTVLNPFNVQLGNFSSVTATGLLNDPTQATIVNLDPFGMLRSVSAITDGSGRYSALRGIEGAQLYDAGLVTQAGIAPSLQCPYIATINVTAATQLVTNTGGQAIHVCAFAVVMAGAESVSLVEGTGSTCATGTKGLYGGTSASIAFAANGGSNLLSDRIILPMQVRGDNLCLLKSAANNASGTLVYGLY